MRIGGVDIEFLVPRNIIENAATTTHHTNMLYLVEQIRHIAQSEFDHWVNDRLLACVVVSSGVLLGQEPTDSGVSGG